MMDFIGNTKTMILHLDDCEYGLKSHPTNIELFSEITHALSRGYSECGWCIGEQRFMEHNLHYLNSRKKTRNIGGCLICGETRGIQRAHIVPKRFGGTETMPLCPNHHWNYDHGLLTKDELGKLLSMVPAVAGCRASPEISPKSPETP